MLRPTRKLFLFNSIPKLSLQEAYSPQSPNFTLMETLMEKANIVDFYEPYWFTDFCQVSILKVAEVFNITYLPAVFLVVIGLRALAAPFFIHNTKILREKHKLLLERKLLEHKVQVSVDDAYSLKIARKNLYSFSEKHGQFISFRGVLVPILTQFPTFLATRAALRGMSTHPFYYKAVATCNPNFFWPTHSLFVPDTTFCLPLLAVSLMGTHAAFTAETPPSSINIGKQNLEGFREVLLGSNAQETAFRAFLVFGSYMLLTSPFNPSSIYVAMIASNSFSILQGGLLRRNDVCDYLKIPRYNFQKEAAVNFNQTHIEASRKKVYIFFDKQHNHTTSTTSSSHNTSVHYDKTRVKANTSISPTNPRVNLQTPQDTTRMRSPIRPNMPVAAA